MGAGDPQAFLKGQIHRLLRKGAIVSFLWAGLLALTLVLKTPSWEHRGCRGSKAAPTPTPTTHPVSGRLQRTSDFYGG